MKEIADLALSLCSSQADAEAVLLNLTKRLQVVFPKLVTAQPSEHRTPCVCGALMAGLNKVRSFHAVQSSRPVLTSLDRVVRDAGITRAQAHSQGLHISAGAWRRAGGLVEVLPTGRPKKDRGEIIEMVRDTVMKHSRETVDVAFGWENGAKVQKPKRVLTQSKMSLWYESAAIMSKMSLRIFRETLRNHFWFVRYSKNQSDVCDHCVCLQKSIAPRFWEDIKECTRSLEEIAPSIMSDFLVGRLAVDDAAAYCGRFVLHLSTYIDRHRCHGSPLPYLMTTS
jgi:hypothetical protein